MINISIVIFNQNQVLLKSIIDKISESKYVSHIYIIDNSRNYNNNISLFKGITYIFNNKNLGYGSGHNIAIKKSIEDRVKYHLVINPDIYFEPKVLEELVKYMEINEDIGLIMPKVNYPNGKTQYICKLLPTPIDLIGRRFIPFKKWMKVRNIKYELQFTSYKKTMRVPSLSGCFMFLRTETLKQVGGFDERFFMYCEDLDLCRRVGQVSKTIFYPEVSITHNYEKGSYKNSKLLKYHINSALKYFNKWGWFLDMERKRINKETLLSLAYKSK